MSGTCPETSPVENLKKNRKLDVTKAWSRDHSLKKYAEIGVTITSQRALTTEETAKVIATLQQEGFALSPSDLQFMPGVLYCPPRALRWICAGADGAPPLEAQPGDRIGSFLRIEPQGDGGRLLTCAVDDARIVTCQLDADGRPMSIDDSWSLGRLGVDYEYDEEGRLHRETMIHHISGELVRGFHAEFFYGNDNSRRSVRVTDLTGRTVEVRSYGPLGHLDEWHTLNDACQVSCREQFQYDAWGRLQSSRRLRFAATEPWNPVRDWTESREYCPRSGGLLRSTLTECRNEADPDEERPAWTVVAVETIDYDPEHPGAPLRDETQYFTRDAQGNHILGNRILMQYRMVHPEGDLRTRIIDEDLHSGEVRERWDREEG